MSSQSADNSPHLKIGNPAASAGRLAKIAGGLYLVVIVGGAFSEAFVRMRLMVRGEAAATAAQILAHEQLFRWGFIADLIPLLCNMGLAVIFYHLFKVVNRNLAALATLFALMGTAIQGSVLLYHLVPLMLLKGGLSLSALTPEQLQALAYFALRMQTTGYTIALAFFGCFGLCLGFLIWKATFLPRILGVLMAVAGFCYFTNSMLSFVAPSLSSVAFLLPCLVGEASLTFWLLLKGVNEQRWKEQAGTAPANSNPT